MIKKFVTGVGYALKGIAMGIKEECNVRIDIVAMIYVLWFSHFYSFSRAEMALVVLVCFVVPAFELMNTAVERAVDKPDAAHYDAAGRAKDAAAGGVLVAAMGAVAVAVVLFGDIAVLKGVLNHFVTDIPRLTGFFLSVAAAYLFIISDKFTGEK